MHEALEQELHLERDWFFFLNGSDSQYWDSFFYIYSLIGTWIVLYLCFIVVFVYKRPWKEVVCTLLAVALVIAVCDQVTSSVFKPVFHRFRPTHHPDFENLVDTVKDYRGGLYGFISGHAANSFGIATFATLVFRNRLFTASILTFAVLNAYSRIYLGVHFISDIAAGALLGVLAGYLGYLFMNFLRAKWVKVDKSELQKPLFPARTATALSAIYGIHLLFLLAFSNQIIKFL
ncbi:MAG: phosphatase PAP2 family protein [Dysgonamonadaceae bacterium]|jgi:undecaprenyl-diphosphatase|nr:phosphatase PAP2 family protein [Dysgonamonadaceae bacterium]